MKIILCLSILFFAATSPAVRLINAESGDTTFSRAAPPDVIPVQQRYPLEKLFLDSPIADIGGRSEDRNSFCKQEKSKMQLDQCLGEFFRKNGKDIPFRFCAAYVCDAMLTYEPPERRGRCLRAIMNRYITCEQARICERRYQDAEMLISCFEDLSTTTPLINQDMEREPATPPPPRGKGSEGNTDGGQITNPTFGGPVTMEGCRKITNQNERRLCVRRFQGQLD